MGRRAWRLALACLALSPAVAAARPTLPRPAVGVLAAPAEHPWGLYYEPGFSWEWARSEKVSKLRFNAGDDTFVPELPPVAPPQTQLEAARVFGVVRPVHLVELEIDAAKPQRGPHVPVTSLRVLDGTGEVTWVLADLLQTLRRRFDASVDQRRGALTAELATAKEKLRADPGGAILRELPLEEVVVYRPTWRGESRRLEVVFGYKQRGGFWIASRPRQENRRVKYAPPPPERGVSYAATMGARYVVDARGVIVAEEVFPPGQRSLPWQPPPPAPQPATSALRLHRSCGDNVCRDGGYRGPFAGVPPCGERREGEACATRGEQCDLQNDCNMFLVCSEARPSQCPR